MQVEFPPSQPDPNESWQQYTPPSYGQDAYSFGQPQGGATVPGGPVAPGAPGAPGGPGVPSGPAGPGAPAFPGAGPEPDPKQAKKSKSKPAKAAKAPKAGQTGADGRAKIRTYDYKVKTGQGVMLRGSVRAMSEEQARALVSQPGCEVVKLKPASEFFSMSVGGGKVKTDELVVFAQQLSAFVRAGVPLVDALQTIGSDNSSRLMQDTLREVCLDLSLGTSLSAAMAPHKKVFPEFFVDLVRAGEVTGGLDHVLDQAAHYLERQYEASQKIKSALAYPAVIGMVALGTVAILIQFVLPKFVTFFKGFNAKLPAPTRALLAIADFFKHYGVIVFLVVVALGVLLWAWRKTENGRFMMDRILLDLPGIGPIVQYSIVERFCATLAMLVRAGVPLPHVFAVVIDGSKNRVFQRALTEVQRQMLTGMGMSGPIGATGLFPPIITQMMRVGESTGTLDSQLEIAAEFFGKKLDFKLKRFTTVFEPLVIVVMGAIVGFVAVALVSAMYGIFTQIRQVKH